MASYLIEFRFHGKAKHKIKKLIYEVNRNFRLRKRREVPHISLAGPFYTDDEKRLIKDFRQLCVDHPLMKFKIDGFNTFEHSKVVFLDVNPSKELDDFRWKLSQSLKKYCKLRPFDYEKKFSFHSTIAMKLPEERFKKIKSYVKNKPKINFNHVVVRMTLLKGQKILKEYDFFLRRLLNRKMAKNKGIYSKTSSLLKAHFEDRFNPEEFTGSTLRVPRKNIFSKIKDLFGSPKTFITSDLHLDHTNIIKYCDRPFINTKDMNDTLINNWNKIIRKKDTVYFLGDLAFGRGSKSTDYWLNKLNGKIIFIKGNHDKSNKTELLDNFILEYKGKKFFLTHRPENVPKKWKGWSICGHHHNNKPQDFPLINKKNKRINISTELTKYKPVELDEIIEKIN